MKTLQRVFALAKRHPVITIVLLLTFAVLAYYFRGSLTQAWSSHQVNRQDQKLQQQIDASEKAAGEAESNANTHRDNRLQAEGRYQAALEQQKAAEANSNRSAEQVRKARQRYEETRRSRTADAPTLSDAELCAELTKRGIDCR